VANCPGLGEAAGLPAREGGAGELRLWYHGALNEELLPGVVLEAMARAGEGIRLDFAGYESVFTPGYIESYLRRAEALGLGGRVGYAGVFPREELLRRAAGADVGLALFQPSFPQPLAGASNKVFDYLLAGLPAVLPETEEWREYEAAGVATRCAATDAAAVAGLLEALRDGREALGPMRERGMEMIRRRWNYEAQFGPVLELLEEAARG
jgi:glycosyltransferase involved in cell wall biosynthesis